MVVTAALALALLAPATAFFCAARERKETSQQFVEPACRACCSLTTGRIGVVVVGKEARPLDVYRMVCGEYSRLEGENAGRAVSSAT